MSNRTEAPKIHVDMFKPDFGGSRQVSERFNDWTRYYFGESGSQLLSGTHNSGLSDDMLDALSSATDQYYWNVTRQTFMFPPSTTPQVAFREGGRVAIDVVRHLASLAGFSDSNPPVRDELGFTPASPSQLLTYLSLDDGSNTLGWQTRRDLLLAVIHQDLSTRSGNGAVEDALFRIQGALSREFYIEGVPGVNPVHHCYSVHEIKSNELQRFVEAPKGLNENIRVYENEFPNRIIRSTSDVVYTNARSKDPISAVEKAVSRALLSRRGLVDAGVVNDYMGFKAIVLQDHGAIADLGAVDRVHDAYISALGGKSKRQSRIVPMDQVDNSRGQAPVRFRRSWVFTAGIDVPIEVIVTSERDGIAQMRHVGTRGADGLYDGQAHGLFMIRRNAPVAKLLLGDKGNLPRIEQGLVLASARVADSIKTNPSVAKTSDEHKNYL